MLRRILLPSPERFLVINLKSSTSGLSDLAILASSSGVNLVFPSSVRRLHTPALGRFPTLLPKSILARFITPEEGLGESFSKSGISDATIHFAVLSAKVNLSFSSSSGGKA